jgi:ABC-type uncharacterized transport system ATPase subunit
VTAVRPGAGDPLDPHSRADADAYAEGHRNAGPHWELEVAENADTQAILEACFQNKIRLKQFDHSEPSLHDVFVKLVGADAREAAVR